MYRLFHAENEVESIISRSWQTFCLRKRSPRATKRAMKARNSTSKAVGVITAAQNEHPNVERRCSFHFRRVHKPPESPEQSQRRPGSRNDLPIGAMCVGSLLLAPPLVGTLRPKWTGRYSSGFLCHLAFNGLELLSAHVLPHSGVFSTRCGDGGTPSRTENVMSSHDFS